MINYSITMRSVNANLLEINQAKSRINQTKKKGKMKAETWKTILQIAISFLTAIATSLGILSNVG